MAIKERCAVFVSKDKFYCSEIGESVAVVASVTGLIHCQCIAEESKVDILQRLELGSQHELTERRSSAASQDQSSFCIVSTSPQTLGENISLSSGEEYSGNECISIDFSL